MKICAIIAAFNEEDTIGQVVSGVLDYSSKVVVIDDGSTDQTGDCATAAGATVLTHPRNQGKGAAVRTGLAYVLSQPFSHVLFIDGDMQHDPEDIPRLVAAARDSRADFVIAEREFTKGKMPTARYYSNRIGSRILSAFLGTTVSDSQSGFRLVNSDCLRDLHLTAMGYELETEMLIKLVKRRVLPCRIDIAAQYHGSNSKLRSFRDTFRTCMLAVWYRYLDVR